MMTFEQLHLAMQNCSSAANYFAMAWAVDDDGSAREAWHGSGVDMLTHAANVLGFDLVPRETAAVKLEAAE